MSPVPAHNFNSVRDYFSCWANEDFIVFMAKPEGSCSEDLRSFSSNIKSSHMPILQVDI